MPKALLELGVIAGGTVFAVAGLLALGFGGRSWTLAAFAGAAAAAGLALCVLADREIRRRRREARAAAIEAARGARDSYEVPVLWSRWQLQLQLGAVAFGCLLLILAWGPSDRLLRLGASLFLILGVPVAFLTLLRVGLPASRAGYFLRIDQHGLYHFSKGYISWSGVSAVDLMREINPSLRLTRRSDYDYFLVLTLRTDGPLSRQGRVIRFIGSWSAPFISRPGCVILPLEYADDEPLAVLAAAREFARRFGVPVEEGLALRPLDPPPQTFLQARQRALPDRRSLAAPAAVAAFMLVIFFLLQWGLI